MFCKNCGNEVDEKAAACPKCGFAIAHKPAKKSIFKKWWFWVVVGVIVIAIAGGSSGGSDTSNDSENDKTAISGVTDPGTQDKAQDEVTVYEKVELQTMLDDLKANALKAEKTYQNKYVEVTGKITSFDSDGSYISIEPVDADEWNFETVMCKIKNEEQLNFLLEKSVGDKVTITGQITSVGEVLGYTIKMDEVR